MKKFKRLMALAAVSMLGIQLMGVGVALAGGDDSDSECDFGSDSLEVTLGYDGSSPDASAFGDVGDAMIWVDSDGILWCEDSTNDTDNPYSQAASSIDSITVEMDDDDSNGNLVIRLDDEPDEPGDVDVNAAGWPSFDTFDVAATTRLIFDGSKVEGGAANGLSVTVGKSTFAFSGTEGTYTASSLQFADGGDDDIFDASKATVRVYADGTGEGTEDEAGDDIFKGGSGNDRFELSGYAEGDDVIVYGNGGNDLIETGSGKNDQGWGGEGSDTIDLGGDGKDTAAPGAGDDDIESADRVSYGDLTGGIEYTDSGLTGDVTTGGAAGDDTFDDNPTYLIATGHDDVILDSNGDLAVVSAGAGNDIVKVSQAYVDEEPEEDQTECIDEDAPCGAYVLGGAGNDLIVALDAGDGAEDTFYGNAGNDILKGKNGNDELRGGPGQDQAWGGNGAGDLCTAEVLNRCEYIKK